jgi:hypothetical protein
MISAYRVGSISRVAVCRRQLSSDGGKQLRRGRPLKAPAPGAAPSKPPLSGPAGAKTQGIGTGKSGPGMFIKDRGPVSWPSLFLCGIAAASCVAYYNIERERRLETAMGRVVSSESDGWTPNPDVMAKRKFKLTPWGWFPEDDGFGPCKSCFLRMSKERKIQVLLHNLPRGQWNYHFRGYVVFCASGFFLFV